MKIIVNIAEKECAQSGLKVKFIGIDQANPAQNIKTIRSFHNDETVIGYLYNLWMTGQWHKPQLDYLRMLALHNKPLAIMDNSVEFITEPLRNKNVQVFRIDSYDAGQQVGRLLFHRGHKKVAYLSLWHRYKWWCDRLLGIKNIYHKAGLMESVVEFTRPDNPRDLLALCKRAVSHDGVTAWVCSNDNLALTAMDFLSSRKIKVPEQLSVVGFDNTILSFENKFNNR